MLLRRIARPMLATVFIQGGIQQLRAPEAHAQMAKPALDVVSPAVEKATVTAAEKTSVDIPVTRPDDVTIAKIDGGVKVVAGTMLALGHYPRLASTALAASLIPTTFGGHRFWEESDPQLRQQQMIHFLKNVSLLGGLLIAAADTEGRPSLGWRGRRAARLASTAAASQAAMLSGTATELSGALSGATHNVSGRVSGAAQEVAGRVSGAAHDVAGRVSGAAHEARGTLAGLAAGTAGMASAVAAQTWRKWGKAKRRRKSANRAAALQQAALRRGTELQKEAVKRGAALQAAATAGGARLMGKPAKRQSRTDRRATLMGQASKLGQDVAARASSLGAEVVHQAEGVAKDARKRVAALTH